MAILRINRTTEWLTLMGNLRAIRDFAKNTRVAMAAGPISANAVLQVAQYAAANRALIAGIDTTLLGEWFKAETGDATAALATERTAILAALDAIVATVVGTFPTSGGYILKDTLNADGTVSVRAFTAAQTATLQAQLAALESAIG